MTNLLTAPGSDFVMTALAGGVEPGGVTVEVVENVVTVHYEEGVSLISQVETAITALAGADDIIDVKTAGTAGTALLAANAFAATALTGGVDAFTDADEILVTGRIVDAAGSAVPGVRNVLLATKGATNGQGAVTALTGKATAKHGDGTVSLWLQTLADGTFGTKVADTEAESILFEAQADGCVPVFSTLTFVA